MYQNDAEMLFPVRVIELLRLLRGDRWRVLVDRVLGRPEHDPDLLAFSLLMIRLGGCLSCGPDSYRAIRGCTLCAKQSVMRFKGSDDEIIRLWESARADVVAWLESGVAPTA